MADLNMDATAAPLDLSLAPFDVLTQILQTMCEKDRFICALVCKSSAAAATRTVTVWQPSVQKFSCFQQWMEKHGDQLEVLLLHGCSGVALTAMPFAQLQRLLLYGGFQVGSYINVSSRVWGNIAAATKLTSMVLSGVKTASQQADVVSALTALPDLKHLVWLDVQCNGKQKLSDSLLLAHLTKLTVLDLRGVSAAALQHLGSLTKLQGMSVSEAEDWAAAGCPGLQELKALTRLQLLQGVEDMPASVCQLTALQELKVFKASQTAIISLQVLTGLTHLEVQDLGGLSVGTPPLQLPV